MDFGLVGVALAAVWLSHRYRQVLARYSRVEYALTTLARRAAILTVSLAMPLAIALACAAIFSRSTGHALLGQEPEALYTYALGGALALLVAVETTVAIYALRQAIDARRMQRIDPRGELRGGLRVEGISSAR